MDGVNATVIDEDLEGAALIAGRGQDEEVTYDGLTAMLATCYKRTVFLTYLYLRYSELS